MKNGPGPRTPAQPVQTLSRMLPALCSRVEQPCVVVKEKMDDETRVTRGATEGRGRKDWGGRGTLSGEKFETVPKLKGTERRTATDPTAERVFHLTQRRWSINKADYLMIWAYLNGNSPKFDKF